MITHTHEYRASAVLILMNTEQVCTHTQLTLLEYFAGAHLASRASHTPRHSARPRAPLAPRAPRAYPPSRGAESATSEITTTTPRDKDRPRSLRSALGSQLAAPSLARAQSVLASAVASDSTSSSSAWDWPALWYLQKYRLRMACLLGMKVFLLNAYQRGQPMRVEIRIGESAGEGDDLLDIGLVVQM